MVLIFIFIWGIGQKTGRLTSRGKKIYCMILDKLVCTCGTCKHVRVKIISNRYKVLKSQKIKKIYRLLVAKILLFLYKKNFLWRESIL